jgi:hypothetical protein
MSAVDRWGITAAGLLITALLFSISLLDDPRENLSLFLILFAAAFAAYLIGLFFIMRLRTSSRRFLGFIIVIAILTRGVFLFDTPLLSNDAYRYLWEGRIILSGYNPFAYAPASPELVQLRNDDYANINHKELATIYPPFAQAVFTLGAAVHADVRMQKALFFLFDMGTLLVLIGFLRMRGGNGALGAVYGWSPLAAVEFAHSGHLDPIAIFFMMLGILLIARARRVGGFIALGLSFLSKFASVLFLPYFLSRKRYAAYVCIFIIVVVLGYVPFAGASSGLFSSLKIYAGQWEFNSASFGVIKALGAGPLWTRRVLFVLMLAFVLWRSARRTELLRYAYLVISCSLLLSPTVYPWYVTWILPFLCFYPNKAWLLFSGLVVASYWAWARLPASQEWSPGATVMWIEYAPFVCLLVWEGLRTRRRRNVEAPPQ